MSEITTIIDDVTEPLKATEVDASSPASISAFVLSQEEHDADISDNFVPQVNAVGEEMNVVADEVNTNALNAQAAGNYQGDWSLTPTLPVVYPYPLGISVSHGGFRWASKVNSNSEEPVAETANWAKLPEAGIASVEDDIDPNLGGDLDPNGFKIIGYQPPRFYKGYFRGL